MRLVVSTVVMLAFVAAFATVPRAGNMRGTELI